MWMPPSTQASEVTVIDPTILQRPRKGLRGELRVAPRSRDGTDIAQQLDRMTFEQARESLEREGGMSDCPQSA